MKIKQLRVSGLYGYLDFNVNFYNDITFLIGINGSGKTSILNVLSWVITPSLKDLATNEFRSISITVSDRGKDEIINVFKKGKKEKIIFNRSGNEIEIPLEVKDEDFRNSFINNNEEVLKFINSLPSTPIFLPLNRIRKSEKRIPFRRRSRNKIIYSRYSTIDKSLEEILNLVEKVYREKQTELNKFNEELRKQLVISTFRYHKKKMTRPWSSKEVKRKRRIIKQAMKSVGIFENQTGNTYFDDFFNRLENVATKLDNKDKSKNNDELTDEMFEWLINSPQIQRIDDLIDLIKEYNKTREELFSEINSFLDVINSFFEDTNKNVEFDKTGEIVVKFKKIQRSVSTLSSGERQLLIIFAHLFFGIDKNNSLIYMVDEPELSLHLKWQNQFAKLLKKASPNSQFILATHSPEIVNGNNEKVIEVYPQGGF